MAQYHDLEWGVPVHSDRKLFEFLILEGAQAGLTWQTVLNKREGYRKAFAGFDPVKLSKLKTKDVERLMKNPEIVRNRLKITSVITNAQAFLKIKSEFGSFDSYIWQFVGGKPINHKVRSLKDIPTSTKEAELMSKDLLKRGFKFVGPTICYAYMQAVGMVNDHELGCFRRKQI